MKTGHRWTELRDLHAPDQVAPVRFLRPSSDDALQYYGKGGELLAIRGLDPYGILSDTGGQGSHFRLLEVVDRQADHSIFAVPEDALTLHAVTMARGRQEMSFVAESYARVGQAIGEAANRYRVPGLRVGDFAIDRSDGMPIFVPPVHFGEGTQDLRTHEAVFADSLGEHFKGLLQPTEATLLLGGLRRGIAYGAGA